MDTAIPNNEPISPNHPIDITLSAMVGIAGGLAFVILREILAQTLEQPRPPGTVVEQPGQPTLPVSPLDPIPLPIQKPETSSPDEKEEKKQEGKKSKRMP